MRSLSFLMVLALVSVAPAAQRPSRPMAPHSGIRTTRLDVHVSVVDGVATTRLVQRIRNDSSRDMAEADWVLPLPVGAVADEFEMTANGVKLGSEVLDGTRARSVYESIVRRRRDPGLLEYAGQGCLRARVFPIPRGGEVVVEVTFRHVLPRVGGLSRWSFPVRVAGVDGKAPEEVTLDLSLASRRPIKNAYSPVKGVEVVQRGELAVHASFEGKGDALPDGELGLFYGLSEADFGLDLLSHRADGDDEGTFLMLISPKRDWDDMGVIAKEITFVLDTSGSMAGEKLEQALASLRYFLRSLRADDRFNVVPFSTEPRPFFDAPVDATDEKIEVALSRARRIEAVGGTNIADALPAGLVRSAEPGERVPIVVFLTDGLPTVGVTQEGAIRARVRDRNGDGARIFVLGVGPDVNTHLLDGLAAETRGTRDYVRPGENVELAASGLFKKLSRPVMTDLSLEVDGLEVSRLVPARLADLFEGECIELFGRYAGSGPRAIRLSGTVRGEHRSYVYEGTFDDGGQGGFDFLPPLWAERRVGILLDAIRLNGPDQELVAEVTRLGREYRIVTPYTSHLILEDGLQVAAGTDAFGMGGAFRGQGDTIPRREPGPGPSSGPTLPQGPLAPNSPISTPPRTIDVRLVANGLRENEVLAEDADDGTYLALAKQLVDRLEGSERARAQLVFGRADGQQAVDQSLYLKDLIAGERTEDGEDSVLALFTRRVRDKVFELRRGVWTDRELDPEGEYEHVRVESYTAEYFGLVRAHPELARYLGVGERLRVLLDGKLIEVV